MSYLWCWDECPDKHVAEYDSSVSPDRLLLRKGVELSLGHFNQCDCYVRSTELDLPDDPFIRTQLRHTRHAAYIFTPEQLFYCNSFLVTKINIDPASIRELKIALSLTDNDIDKKPKVLSNQELQIISSFKDCPKFSRVPILRLKATTAEIQKKYDAITNNSGAPLVNQKIVDLLIKIAPDEVQFFDAEVHCKDGILTDYKLLNVTRTFIGIDREKSICKMMSQAPDEILGFKYLTYKPGCMGNLKLARDEEYLGNLLVTEQVKKAFEQEKIKGCRFVRPEDFYRPMTG